MIRIPSNDKRCYNCEYWHGQREVGPGSQGTWIICPNHRDARNTAYCDKTRQDKPASAGCPYFVKWRCLK